MVEMAELSAGKGPGTLPLPRFFDAATLDEITDPTAIPPVEGGCEGSVILGDPVDGRVYRGEVYSRYESFNNLLVYDLAGNLLTWRDGLSLGVTNKRTHQMYAYHRDDVLVLDLVSLSPVGTLPTECIHTVETGTGLLYGFGWGKLSIFAETGGRAQVPRTAPVGALPSTEIASIQPSPDYAADSTVFVMTSSQLFRSSDGGASWTHLRGGLPEGYWLSLDIAASPDFATDGTLFAGGFRGSFWGEGVYRSTDRGDTWQPMWNGLTHLRVYHLAVSPNYATDRTLIAYSRFQMIEPDENGLSVFRSTDGGQNWALEMTQPQGASMPAPAYLLPVAAGAADLAPPAMRADGFASGVERTFDAGITWQPVVIPGQPKMLFVKAVLPSPDRYEPDTYYVVAEAGLYRTPDRGNTWQRCLDERLAGRDVLERRITAGATSPWQDQTGYQIFLGTAAGEFLVVDPYATAWQDLSARVEPPPPPPPPPEPPTPTPPPVVRTMCQVSVAERLAGLYADPRVGSRLGCPLADATTLWAAYEPFERGAMIWLSDTRTIAVLYGTGAWVRYSDTWDESQPSSDTGLAAPAGLVQPVRGFGKIWREQLGGPHSAIGWALGPEAGYDILKQEFERGTMLIGPEEVTYLLYADGGWEGR
jgi:photosystem II stability/assembly factor-like uncharacterized protein